MVWVQRLWLRIQSLSHRSRSAQQFDDEIQFHLEQQIAENIAAGMSREDARYAAMRTFGNPTVLKEETRASASGNHRAACTAIPYPTTRTSCKTKQVVERIVERFAGRGASNAADVFKMRALCSRLFHKTLVPTRYGRNSSIAFSDGSTFLRTMA